MRKQMTALERFLKYITFDTQSEEGSEATPSTEKQRALGRVLARELAEMGLEGACLADNGAGYGGLPATPGREDVPVIASSPTWTRRPGSPGDR